VKTPIKFLFKLLIVSFRLYKNPFKGLRFFLKITFTVTAITACLELEPFLSTGRVKIKPATPDSLKLIHLNHVGAWTGKYPEGRLTNRKGFCLKEYCFWYTDCGGSLCSGGS